MVLDYLCAYQFNHLINVKLKVKFCSAFYLIVYFKPIDWKIFVNFFRVFKLQNPLARLHVEANSLLVVLNGASIEYLLQRTLCLIILRLNLCYQQDTFGVELFKFAIEEFLVFEVAGLEGTTNSHCFLRVECSELLDWLEILDFSYTFLDHWYPRGFSSKFYSINLDIRNEQNVRIELLEFINCLL